MSEKILTQEELKRLLDYDENTGIFKWIANPKNHVKIGNIAGFLSYSIDKVSPYSVIGVNGERYKSHRLAWLYMTGSFPLQIDHIDGDRLNNKFVNLRNVAPSDNAKNVRVGRRSKTGVIGVTVFKKGWRAMITSNGKCIHLGLFESFEDACLVRYIAERRYGFHENHGRTG